MSSERVSLHFRQGKAVVPFVATVREPCGHDELRLDGIDTRNAVALLERVVDESLQRQGGVWALGVSDRDALLAALHRLCWGDRILADVRCQACGQRFDLSFTLSALQRALYDARPPLPEPWQVPTASDELEAAALGDQASMLSDLASRCGVELAEMEAAALALEQAAPILDLELQARCPECGEGQNVGFDLQSFVLKRLLAERHLLLDEIHILADRYGWSLHEILGLDRSTRRTLAERILGGRRL